MNDDQWLRLRGFYENELCNRILAFWLPRCEDCNFGGYFNCFDNMGESLVSRDKYTWSQGRFVWMFSRLAMIKAPIFSVEQKEEFLRLAKSGSDFLMKHCLISDNDVRCVYLMEEDGTPKHVDGFEPLDMSIYADCFVILGMACFSVAANDRKAYTFAKRLYDSVLERINSGDFHTLPYPLPAEYRAHGIPMILSNVTREMYAAATKLDVNYTPFLLERLEKYATDILEHFVDEDNVIHEVIHGDKKFVPGILGQHANPGHTIEDMWFMVDTADILKCPDIANRAFEIAEKALEVGWDKELGGILHYCDVKGGEPKGIAKEPIEIQVLEGWGDKLWWVHSEALYTTLLCYTRTRKQSFWDWHEKVFEYTFKVFPNENPQVREWKQILKRDGTPQEKVVALPVKDPFHITRNLILILELLENLK